MRNIFVAHIVYVCYTHVIQFTSASFSNVTWLRTRSVCLLLTYDLKLNNSQGPIAHYNLETIMASNNLVHYCNMQATEPKLPSQPWCLTHVPQISDDDSLEWNYKNQIKRKPQHMFGCKPEIKANRRWCSGEHRTICGMRYAYDCHIMSSITRVYMSLSLELEVYAPKTCMYLSKERQFQDARPSQKQHVWYEWCAYEMCDFYW